LPTTPSIPSRRSGAAASLSPPDGNGIKIYFIVSDPAAK